MQRLSRFLSVCLAISLWPMATPLGAQQNVPPVLPPATGDSPIIQQTQPGQPQQAQPPAQQTAPAGEALRPNYVLGPGDQIMIRAFEMEEIGERPLLIDGDGNINIPRLGVVHAAGLTVPQLEAHLATLLRRYVQQPQVNIQITQFRSEPVFFEGAFVHPSIVALQGRRTLIEMITAVGGLLPNASHYVTVTRQKAVGSIPLPNAVSSPDGKVSTVTISLASLRDDISPAENIILEPYDVIRAERAEYIYVNGAIGRVGGIDLLEKESMSVTQLVTLAGGLRPEADPTKVVVLRPVMNTSKRAEIPLNLNRIMSGKDTDFPLLANDLLYVPQKGGLKTNLGKAALIGIPLAVTLAITLVRIGGY